MSESTTGITHAAEASTHTHPHTSTPSQLTDDDSHRPTPVLPEDIGKQAALSLIEKIVKVHFIGPNTTLSPCS